MTTLPSSEPILPANWTAVLAGIEQALQQAVAQTTEGERSLPPAAPTEPARSPYLERFEQHLAQLTARARKAEEETAAADAAFADGAARTSRWLEEVRAVAGRLASAAARAI
jgi:hypothetical protein